MQIPKSAIERAIEGGWHSEYPDCQIITCSDWYITVGSNQLNCKGTASSSVALDPTFWRALGEALGWELYTPSYEYDGEVSYHATWHEKAKQFYDLILKGKDTMEFWKELLANK